MTRHIFPRAGLLALALALVMPVAARSQARAVPRAPDPDPIVNMRNLALLLKAQPAPDTWHTQRGTPPLDIKILERMRRASDLRMAGLVAQARDTLLALERLAPMHPLLETELARTEMALGEMAAAVERLRSLRAATRDTVVGAHDLALALERLARPGDAAQVAIESWSVARVEGPWALEQVLRLAPLDARRVTESLRAAAQGRPARTDLLLGWAEVPACRLPADTAIKVRDCYRATTSWRHGR